jgi:hypothetical protein
VDFALRTPARDRTNPVPDLGPSSVAGSTRRRSVRLYPAMEGHFRRVTARLCASQHGHATGFAVALEDGQALVLD